MSSDSVPAELLAAREKIDQIDRDLIALLAQRFALTHEVGVLKADKQLKALDSTRESEKLAELTSLCEQHKLNPQFISDLFSKIMEEVVKNHQRLGV